MQSKVDLTPRPITVIGVPGSRRVAAFTEAAQRLGLGPVEVTSYLDFIAGRPPTLHPDSLIRIESPSECAATTRAILKAGIAPLEAHRGVPLSETEIDRLACDRGEMLHPRQWFLGFREILAQLDACGTEGDVRWMSAPRAIATTFDKLACLELWSQAGLPVPPRFPGIKTYAQLRREIPQRHARVFIKLRYGYSAMGAVALEWRGSLVRALTPMEVVWAHGRPRLFVTRRPRVLTREFEISWLVDTLAVEEILVEDWLPKARWNGKPYDVRAVMINGQVQHLVGWANGSPFTNLNLDATRIPRESVEHHLGGSWCEFDALCRQAAFRIPCAGILGLDVFVRPCRRRFALLEANAFGDYLPGLTYRGQSTYEAELSEFCRTGEGIAT
jgi:hypothetical protein